MLVYGCLIVILFSSILQLVELFWTHKNQSFEVDVLTGNSVSTPNFSSFIMTLVMESSEIFMYIDAGK